MMKIAQASFQFYPRSTYKKNDRLSRIFPLTFNSIQDQPKVLVEKVDQVGNDFQFYPRSTGVADVVGLLISIAFNSIQDQQSLFI